MRRSIHVLLLAIGIPVMLTACTSTRLSPDAYDEANQFIAQLGREGVDVIGRGSASSSFFNRPGLQVRANSTDVIQVFEYNTAAAAERDAQLIDNVQAQSPHFYQKEELVVVHWGDDTEVAIALEDLLGPQVF